VGTLGRALGIVAVVCLGIVSVLGVTGYVLFTRPHADPLTKADAIIVLGGENDGRLQYGLRLAEQGYANTVLLSNSYSAPADLTEYRRACASGTATITVICFVPSPYTTLGEAIFLTRLAKQHNWSHVIVVSWNYHMVRSRYIFHQCFDGTVTMRPVPRDYHFSLRHWATEYAYQYAALMKAFVVGCKID
jgi:uncharacterized SAM-binding protein YcdF (DUF218 family)